MKKAITVFSVLMVCNLSFSQEKKSDLPPKNQNIEKLEVPVFKCHPNPADDELFVIGIHKIKSIEILDMLGESVASYHFDKSIIRLNISELNPGIYLLKVIDKTNKQDSKKLVVK